MIAYLRGKVLDITGETLILDVNGVGYEIYCSARVFSLARRGGELEVYTSMQIKEDGATLYGFSSAKEKELFLKLTSVSGVGPKSGIAVLSTMSADEAATAILTADVKRLSTVKGLGKKTAEKIVLELHGKISAAEVMSASGDFSGGLAIAAATENGLSAADEDAVSALQNLGFTRGESVRAVERAKQSGAKGLEEIIRRALQG